MSGLSGGGGKSAASIPAGAYDAPTLARASAAAAAGGGGFGARGQRAGEVLAGADTVASPPTLPDIPKTTAPDIPKPVVAPVVNDFIDTRPIEDRTPKAPTLSDPATMPSMGSKAVTAAGSQTKAAIAARAGRASTVLTTRKTTTSRPTGTLASGPDTYSKRTLG